MHAPLTPDRPLVLRTPTDLLVEIPALMGFVPAESLVVVLTDRDTIRCTLRWDLDEDLTEMAIRSIGVAHRAEADGAVLAVYTSYVGTEMPLAAQVERFLDLLEEQGIAARDALLVDSGRWWSYCCDDPGCCPPQGHPVPDRVPVLDAERALRGRPVVAATRKQAEGAYVVDLDRELPREAISDAQDALGHHHGIDRARYGFAALEALTAALAGPLDGDLSLCQELAAVLALAAQDVHTRDYVLGRAVQTWADLSAPAAVLVDVALTCPPGLRPAAAATAMALLAADGGDPVGLWAMADLAEDQSLAQLVRIGVEAGFPPEDLREVLTQALPQVEHALNPIRN